MTTIYNRWPHIGHCRLVFSPPSKWRELVSRYFSSFFSYNQVQPSLNVRKYSSRMILHNSERFPKGFYWKSDCYVPSKQLDDYFMFWYNPEPNVLFVLLQYLIQLQTGSSLKSSAGKKKSEPGRYKDRSHSFFIRKFWTLSISNQTQIRNVCFTYMTRFMKRCQ